MSLGIEDTLKWQKGEIMFNLKSARGLMQNEGLDGIIVSTTDNFRYVTGCYPRSILSRSLGAEIVVIPADENEEPAVILSEVDAEGLRDMIAFGDIRTFESWIYFEVEGRVQAITKPKPEQYDPMATVVGAMKDKGLSRGIIGIEEDLTSASFCRRLKEALPNIKLVNATKLFYEMRAIKEPEELEKFRKAVKVTEDAMRAALAIAKVGVTDRDIAQEFKKTAIALGAWVAGHCGHMILGFGPKTGKYPIAGPHPVAILEEGQLLFWDVGVYYDGVVTDMGRAYVMGEPSHRLAKWHETILDANRKMVESIRPGIRFCDLFHIGMEKMRAVYPQYTRGHLGHSISIGPGPEEPPFISAQETRELKPGMVLCVEVPYYIVGFGGIDIEDMVIVTDDGVEELTSLDRGIKIPE